MRKYLNAFWVSPAAVAAVLLLSYITAFTFFSGHLTEFYRSMGADGLGDIRLLSDIIFRFICVQNGLSDKIRKKRMDNFLFFRRRGVFARSGYSALADVYGFNGV